MRGLTPQRTFIAQSKKMGMTHLALTETNGLWGFIHFVQHARDAGILPIAGANILTLQDDVIVLVENQTGYENLCRVLSNVHDDETLPFADILKQNLSGLFILSHQKNTLKQLIRFVPNSHLFVELRPGIAESQAHKLSKAFNLEIVATGDVYFLQPEDWQAHRILRAIEKNTTLSQLSSAYVKNQNCWFRSEKDMVRLFPNSLDALNNSQYLAERCKTDWSFINTIFPDLSLQKTNRADRKLRSLVYRGGEIRYGNITQSINDRIEYELELITQKGFSPYFLVVQDIVCQTKTTIGRGSAAASVVSYCLFITQVDPVRYNLQFERFIHPERVDMPDIDIDFPWDERDDIIDYVFKKYGLHRTAMVSSQVFLQPRSAVREVAKVYGLSNEEIKTVTKRIGWHSRQSNLFAWIKNDNRFKNLNMDSTLEKIIKLSEKIIGTFRTSSVHPGGIVIVPDEIRKYVPVLRATKGVQILEWEKDQTEDSGLLKIDLLGNRSLAVVRDALKQIGVYRSEYINYHDIPPVGDPKTEALMKTGRTMGIFYIESPATRQLLEKAGRVDFEHVVIYSSIIRPAANRFTNLMLERIHGTPWKLPHPDLEFLNESYGIIVYEEQVSMAARKLAGFGYAESDYLRKVISRPSLEHLVPAWQKKFIDGMLKRGYDKKLALNIWDMVQSFSGYSFCKPHSASYAMLSFTCAYLKAHFPAEFLAAVISNEGGFYSSYAYLSEARRWGVIILPPNINRSFREYRGNKNSIRMGFMAIRNLKEKAVLHILDERKSGDFTSLEDFFMRTDLNLANAMSLTNAGCFTKLELGFTHQQVAFKIACHYLRGGKGENILPSFGNSVLSHHEKMRLERESFGFPVSEHPLTPWLPLFVGKIKKAKDIPRYVGKTIRLAGVLIATKIASTRKRESMEFLTLEDETDIYECILFPKVFQKFGDLLHWETLFIISGTVEESFGVYSVTIEKMASLQQWVRHLNRKSIFLAFSQGQKED